MRELPILFSTEMVQAILAGRKTMTRRSTKLKYINEHPDNWNLALEEECMYYKSPIYLFENDETLEVIEVQYKAEPGDILYVRENWQPDGADILFQADNNFTAGKWKPSIHLPKSASRIWLQIESINIERLQNITNSDALSEGIEDNKRFWPKSTFMKLWERINGFDSWNLNHWVWVISFKVLSTTGKPANI